MSAAPVARGHFATAEAEPSQRGIRPLNETRKSEDLMAQTTASRQDKRPAFIESFRGVRYQVKDVPRSVAFYTQHLGFKLGHQKLPEFADVSLADGEILLSGPGA